MESEICPKCGRTEYINMGIEETGQCSKCNELEKSGKKLTNSYCQYEYKPTDGMLYIDL